MRGEVTAKAKQGGDEQHGQDKRERASAEPADVAYIVAAVSDTDDQTRHNKGDNCYTNGIDEYHPYWFQDGGYAYKP